MNTEAGNFLIGLVGLSIGIITSAATALAWYGNAKKKEYAAERDFAHLKRHYESAAQVLSSLQDDNDRLNNTLTEMKAYIVSISARLEGIYARLDSSTGGWSRKE